MVITVVVAVGLYAIVLMTLLRCLRVLYRKKRGDRIDDASMPSIAAGSDPAQTRAALYAENALLAELSAGRMGRAEYRARLFELASSEDASPLPADLGRDGAADHPRRSGPPPQGI